MTMTREQAEKAISRIVEQLENDGFEEYFIHAETGNRGGAVQCASLSTSGAGRIIASLIQQYGEDVLLAAVVATMSQRCEVADKVEFPEFIEEAK